LPIFTGPVRPATVADVTGHLVENANAICSNGLQRSSRASFRNGPRVIRVMNEPNEIHETPQSKLDLLESVIEDSQDGILVLSLQSEVLYTNRRFHDLWQTGSVDRFVRGQPAIWNSLSTVLADPVPRGMTSNQQQLLTHEVLDTELRLSDQRTLECHSTPLPSAGRFPAARLWSFRDITERKQLEAQFLRAQRLQCLGEVTAGIAHDLRNILGLIAMGLPMLRDEASRPEFIQRLNTLQACASRGVDLVRQMLTFVRGTEWPRAAIDSAELLRDVAFFLEQIFPPSIRIQCEAPDGLWPIFGNRTEFQQMLLNLAINARDAMPSGGVLKLSAANCEGPRVRFHVTDTGCGIAPEIATQIFEPFFTTKEAGQGTGLGLAIVKRIVATHSGHLELKSVPNQGSDFCISLPAAATLPPIPAK
jgi:signal transduction histidine kinase